MLILTLITSTLLAALIWFVIGARLELHEQQRQNELMNFVAYALGAMPVAFVLIFFGLGG